MIFPDINPIILAIGPLAISWYSLSYVIGVLLGWAYANKVIEHFSLGITKKEIESFITFAIIGIIIGGRLGYVALYNADRYLKNPLDILKTYEGGMSFHGGLIGLVVATYLFCYKYKVNFLKLMDILALVAPIGLFFGRIANFINGELYGRVTNVAWGVIFPGEIYPRHPSQLYEAFFEGLVLFLILGYATFKYRSIKTDGLNLALFLTFYSVFRIIIEAFREPDVQIGFIFNSLTMGQILALPMLLVGIYLIIKLRCQSSLK